jgi:hypothetical protein
MVSTRFPNVLTLKRFHRHVPDTSVRVSYQYDWRLVVKRDKNQTCGLTLQIYPLGYVTSIFNIRRMEGKKMSLQRFSTRSLSCQKWLLASSCLSVHTELRSHWTDSEIGTMTILRKLVEKMQDPLKSDNNNGYFAWKPVWILDNTSY